MSTSYKALWQEAVQANDQLKAEIERLRQQHRKEVDRMYASITANRNETAQTRPIVDLAGIARHMKVARFTPQQWVQRELLPPVDFPEIKEPLWYASTIKGGFVVPTGRVWHDYPDEAELSPAA